MNSTLRAWIASGALALLVSTYTFATAAADYKAKCAACHGAKGAGDTVLGRSMNIRDLGSAEVQKQSDEELRSIINTGKGRMPSFNRKLSQEQINELVNWIRTFKK